MRSAILSVGSALLALVSPLVSAVPQVTWEYTSNETVAPLTIAAPSNSDLIEGLVATVVSGSFHPVNFNNLANLTDGTIGTGGGSAGNSILPNDFPGAPGSDVPALTIDYDLGSVTNVGKVVVFAGNEGARVFQHYDLLASVNGTTFTTVREEVLSANGFPTGLAHPAGAHSGRTVTVVADSGSGVLVSARYLRFVFFSVGNTASAFIDPYNGPVPTNGGTPDPRDTDGGAGGENAAIESSIFREIDVFEGAEVFPPTGQTLILAGSFPTRGPCLPLAADLAGGLYYAAFNIGVAASDEAVYYIADPAAEIGDTDPSDHVQLPSSSLSWPAGRGWQGLGINSSGEVYSSGDTGSATNVLKWGSAPTFTADATWNANAATSATGRRWGGLAVVPDSNGYARSVVFSTFNSINWVDALTGTSGGYTNTSPSPASLQNYQREVLYSPFHNIFYPLRNGNSVDDMLIGYYSGGTITAGNYPWTADVIIPDGASSSAFGAATQHGFLDTAVSPETVYTVDTFSDPQPGPGTVRIWEIDPNGTDFTLLRQWDGAVGSAGWTGANDVVRIGAHIYVSVTAQARIYAYTFVPTTAAEQFDLYR